MFTTYNNLGTLVDIAPRAISSVYCFCSRFFPSGLVNRPLRSEVGYSTVIVTKSWLTVVTFAHPVGQV